MRSDRAAQSVRPRDEEIIRRGRYPAIEQPAARGGRPCKQSAVIIAQHKIGQGKGYILAAIVRTDEAFPGTPAIGPVHIFSQRRPGVVGDEDIGDEFDRLSDPECGKGLGDTPGVFSGRTSSLSRITLLDRSSMKTS